MQGQSRAIAGSLEKNRQERTGSGCSEGQALRQTLINQLLGGGMAAAASGAESDGIHQLGESNGALVDGFDDLSIGNGFTQADVHRLYGLSERE